MNFALAAVAAVGFTITLLARGSLHAARGLGANIVADGYRAGFAQSLVEVVGATCFTCGVVAGAVLVISTLVSS